MPGIDLRAVLALAMRGVVREAERVLIGRALEASCGNRTKAAELLEMCVRTLRNKLNRPGKREEDDGAKGVVRCALRRTVEFVRSTVESVRCTVESVRATVELACEAAHPRATWVGGSVWGVRPAGIRSTDLTAVLLLDVAAQPAWSH